jgi:amino-acid N-acetyltransferase
MPHEDPGQRTNDRSLESDLFQCYSLIMDAITHQETIELIREVFHYSHRFQGKTFVFKVDYPVLNSRYFPQLIKDLSLLHRVGIRCVIVPGARERIEEVLDLYGVRTELSGRMRISSPESLPFIKMAAFDVVNRFMTEFSAHSVMSVMGNWVKARSIGVLDGVDYQNSGRVHKIDTEAMVKVLEQGNIPIIPCIGWSTKGKPYNLNSNELALKVAESLQSAKLFFVNELDGLFKPAYQFPPKVIFSTDNRCARLNLEETAAVLEMNKQDNLLLTQLSLGKEACERGVERVHIIDGRIEGVVLKEIFSNLGIGTMVYTDDYEQIRAMEEADISETLRLMDPLVVQGALIPRTKEDIRDNLSDYAIHEIDGTIFGLAALHAFPSEKGIVMGEIAALAVNPYLNLTGIGKRLVGFLEEKAKKAGMSKVFVLTTQTSDWFESLGYLPASIEDLPDSKIKSYDSSRNSRILIKILGSS